jgi:hypothetical protein
VRLKLRGTQLQFPGHCTALDCTLLLMEISKPTPKDLMMKSVLVVLSLAVVCVSCSRPEINRADVVRIISTLAADDMEGRATFSAGIERAQQFVRDEFDDIGLEKLNGLDDYLQQFYAHSMSPQSVKVVLNGREMQSDRVIARVSDASITWTSASDANVQLVGPSGDLRTAIFSAFGGDGNNLIVINESHAETFNRYKRFLSQPSYSLDSTGGSNTVLVLSGVNRVTSLDVEITSAEERKALANVVGVIPGRRSDEMVLFTAHHDHVGISQPVEGDSIMNGANDDASGTTAVIELARYFRASPKPERTLVFATFTGEEIGGFGSDYLAHQLDPDQIVAMFNIEMIGKVGKDGPNAAWITGFEESDFGEILATAVQGTEYSFSADPYPDENLFFRSDNATFARLGVPAHTISTTPIDIDEDYHQVSDELETIDIDHMTAIIKAIAIAAMPIISGEKTPTRIDVSRIN